MTVSKTKAKLVDVARQLFRKDGVENTTMNDIALASKKKVDERSILILKVRMKFIWLLWNRNWIFCRI